MICIMIADGFEETEAVVPADILKRGGTDVKLVGVNSDSATGAGGITLKCDMLLSDVNFKEVDAVVLPGGMPGTKNLNRSEGVRKLTEHCFKNQKLVAAICAAPLIPGHMGILRGKRACCYPGFEGELSGAEVVYDDVCVSGNIITSRGPGTAMDFAFAILEYVKGRECSERVRVSIQCK